MKKSNWISLLLIILFIAALTGYRTLGRLRTDTTPPKITVGDQMLELSSGEPRTALLQGISASDDTDGDVTDSLVVESVRLLHSDGTAAVTYAAFDTSGNVAKADREVRFNDYESPRFSLSQPLLFTQNNSYDILNIIKAEDMLDGDISHRIRATVLDEVSAGYAGTHNVQFRVTNSLGDTVELVLPVEVYTPSIFEAGLSLEEYLIYLKQGDSFNARDYLGEFTLSRETINLRNGIPEGMKLLVSGKVDTGVPGVYVVDYEVTSEQVNQVYTAYSRLIVIVEG